MFESFKTAAHKLRGYAILVYCCARDSRTPNYIRVLALLVAGYAFSPIDLIPDFIPVLGLIDDLIIIPLGVALIMRLTPDEILASARQEAERISTRPISYTAACIIVLLWLLVFALSIQWIVSTVQI